MKIITTLPLLLKHSIRQTQTAWLLNSMLSMFLLLMSGEIFAADYGDAPASYGTPSHTLVGSLKLGVNAPYVRLVVAFIDFDNGGRNG